MTRIDYIPKNLTKYPFVYNLYFDDKLNLYTFRDNTNCYYTRKWKKDYLFNDYIYNKKFIGDSHVKHLKVCKSDLINYLSVEPKPPFRSE